MMVSTKVKVFNRKQDHYAQPRGQEYDVTEITIEGETEQDVLDKFYLKNKRCDAKFHHKFTDVYWEILLNRWYKSEDFSKRSFYLYYQGSFVD